jgi:predicted transcriptional regulator
MKRKKYVLSMRISQELVRRIDKLAQKGMDRGLLPRDLKRSQMIRHLLHLGLTTLED